MCDIHQSPEVMADLGRSDGKWCLIIGKGEKPELQRRPRCDLVVFLLNSEFLK